LRFQIIRIRAQYRNAVQSTSLLEALQSPMASFAPAAAHKGPWVTI